MPMLRNIRHERFAQAMAAGATAEDAYATAGFKSHRQNASRLMTNDDVRRRIDEIRGRSAKDLNVTLAWLMEKAEEARVQAMEKGQTGSAIAAIKELGVLSGYRVERRENMLRSLDEMSDEELEAIAKGGEVPGPQPALRAFGARKTRPRTAH